ncbi:MAG: hypothetical protein H6748_16580 [Spirochaetaceae bacterium]|nr:hypothetical protein [Myxococcales bacterium]MCB9725665.1 hypothetical protein [Spirochaetaceae bacterium]HPG24236.1 hypothetical protein [Myxococcota bacterium]
MEIERGITRYDIMPIPPVEAHTERFEAGPVSIGVEYRLLDDAITAAHISRQDLASQQAPDVIDDRGVSLHVFGRTDGRDVEYLRFDCFDEDPHYHYVSWARKTNEMVHIDPIAQGDPLEWALERIRTRLPQMLARAGAEGLAASVDVRAVEAILPKVTEAAYRARFKHDDGVIHAGALADREAESGATAAGGPRS